MLYVCDSEMERLSVFDPKALGLAYDFTVDRDSLRHPSRLIDVVETGYLLTYGWPMTPGTAREERFYHVMQVDWDGNVAPLPAQRSRAGEWLVTAGGGTIMAMGMPFGRNPVF